MMSYQQAFYTLQKELENIFSKSEATALAHETLEYITGCNKLQRLSEKDKKLTPQQEEKWASAKMRLLNEEPVQYITGVQWFLGKPFKVNKHVLIPRPETEELVQWIISEWKKEPTISILDVGTGSGCISISLKRELPQAEVLSMDISAEALQVAQENAQALNAQVHFSQKDFLEESSTADLENFDIIVSNPPYIPLSEKESLDKNVRDYEPEKALFVPENDALIFYRKMAEFGRTHLKSGGAVYCEIHQNYAAETKALFENFGYRKVTLRKDMHGNERMVKAEM